MHLGRYKKNNFFLLEGFIEITFATKELARCHARQHIIIERRLPTSFGCCNKEHIKKRYILNIERDETTQNAVYESLCI